MNGETSTVKEQIVHTEKLTFESSEMDGKYLTFFTDMQLFGVPIKDVVQIVGMQQITRIPDFPVYAKGVINLRGSIIPVIDVRLRFHKEEKEYDERTCIIVTTIQQTEIGLIVDGVDAVSDIHEKDISPPPEMLGGDTANAYITGIAKHEGNVVLLVDTAKILSNEAVEAMTHTN